MRVCEVRERKRGKEREGGRARGREREREREKRERERIPHGHSMYIVIYTHDNIWDMSIEQQISKGHRTHLIVITSRSPFLLVGS